MNFLCVFHIIWINKKKKLKMSECERTSWVCCEDKWEKFVMTKPSILYSQYIVLTLRECYSNDDGFR